MEHENIKYVVESNGEEQSLLYLLLRDVVKFEGNSGIGKFTSENHLVSLQYRKIGEDWYCFYEPTSQVVKWREVEDLIAKEFPDAEKIKASRIPFKYKEFK